jgi:NADP+-dependent farnesol dehydrogenase
MDKWLNKTAVITGGCSGMGAAILAKFIEHGLRVINLDVSVAENSTSHDGKVFNRRCNVASLESIRENFAWIEEQFGVVHVLVNNAGILRSGNIFDDDSTDKLQLVIDVNFTAVIHCSKEAVRLMKKSDEFCMIINVSSNAGHRVPKPNPFNIYPATKHAVNAFSEIIRDELAGCEKIRVSNLSPGGVMTNILVGSGFVGRTAPAESDSTKSVEKKRVPVIMPEDVANGVIYILSTPENVNVIQLSIEGK